MLTSSTLSTLSTLLGDALSPVFVSASTGVVLVCLCATLGSHRVLRWPLLFVSVAHVAVELTTVALALVGLRVWDAAVERLRPSHKASRLLARLETARSWAEFHAAASQLDAASEGCTRWKHSAEHPKYNARLVLATLQQLRSARAEGDMSALLDVLSGCVRKSFCGIDHEALYARCFGGTKRLVECYVDEVVEALEDVRSRIGRDAAYDERVRSFLLRTQRVFGRTCLALSGGGALANYSWGVVRALYDRQLLPSLICGTSAGAVVAATLCTHTDDELDALLSSGVLTRMLTSFEEDRLTVVRRMWKHGHMYDAGQWAPKIAALCNHAALPHMTFDEAFRLSGRELCVTVTARRRHEPPLVLSRLSSPDVVIASAVLATVAMPFLIPAQRLICKSADGTLRPWSAVGTGDSAAVVAGVAEGKLADGEEGHDACAEWRDGSIMHDTPREQLSQHFGACYTIVSQCNPHVVPLFLALQPTAGHPAVSRLQRGRSDWRGGFALSAMLQLLLCDAQKWLTLLRELEIAPLVLGTDWSMLLTQAFTGEATILPPLAPSDFLRVLADPTEDRMARYLRVGQRETWRRLPMLATRLRIAHALRALQERVTEQQQQQQQPPPPPPPQQPKAPTVKASADAVENVASTNGSAAPPRSSLKRVDSTCYF